jgi:hypothetical protein
MAFFSPINPQPATSANRIPEGKPAENFGVLENRCGFFWQHCE